MKKHLKYANIIAGRDEKVNWNMPMQNYLLTKPIRRLIMSIFIGLFFVIAPLLVLYTSGYRYNWKLHRIDQTGVISIDAEPADANVDLNGIRINQTMPIRLPNRAPGTYLLQISKDGYKSWRKDISVESNKSTYIKNIVLFKENLPASFLPDDNKKTNSFWPSADGLYVIFSQIDQKGNNEYSLIDTNTGIKKPLPELAKKVLPKVSWSPYTHAALIQTEENNIITLQIYDAETNTLSDPSSYPAQSFGKQLIWSHTSKKAYFSHNDVVTSITLSGSNDIEKIPKDLLWHVTEPDIIWLIDQKQNIMYQNGHEAEATAYSNSRIIESIIERTESRMIVKTDTGVVIYHMNPLGGINNNSALELNTPSLLYNASTKEWLAWSPWELWTIYENADATLFNRSSEYTIDVASLDNFGVLLLATNHSLTAFNPGYYVSQELWSGTGIERVSVNKKTKQVFFLGTVEQTRGIWQLGF